MQYSTTSQLFEERICQDFSVFTRGNPLRHSSERMLQTDRTSLSRSS
jgi:hypothetical protein